MARIVASEEALRVGRIAPGELDPVVLVLPAAEVRKIMSDLDAFLPYDDIAPFHSIFEHRPGGTGHAPHGPSPHASPSPGQSPGH